LRSTVADAGVRVYPGTAGGTGALTGTAIVGVAEGCSGLVTVGPEPELAGDAESTDAGMSLDIWVGECWNTEHPASGTVVSRAAAVRATTVRERFTLALPTRPEGTHASARQVPARAKAIRSEMSL
jgi:hypothetical protein